MRIQGIILEDQTNAALRWRECINAFPIERHAATIRLFQAGNDTQQGGLTATGRPDHTHGLTTADPQAGIVQGRQAGGAAGTKLLGDPNEVNFTTCGCG